MTPLKPCPFCGSRGEVLFVSSVPFDDETQWLARVHCQKCPTNGPEISRSTRIEAEECAAVYWNWRVIL